jgi:hypothetical protein
MYFAKNAAVEDYFIKSERLCIPFSIIHNATPTLKTNSNDLPSAMVLDLQGQLAASAIDSGCNFATPTDSTGVFGILLTNLGTIKKLHTASASSLSSGTMVLTPAGVSTSGVTVSGNIAISADWSGDLTATDLSAVLVVDFILDKN